MHRRAISSAKKLESIRKRSLRVIEKPFLAVDTQFTLQVVEILEKKLILRL